MEAKMKDGEDHRQTDRETDRVTERQTDIQTETDRQMDELKVRQTYRQTDRHTDRETDRIKEQVNDNDQARAVQAKFPSKIDSFIAKPSFPLSWPIETKINFGREIEKEKERDKGHLVN